MDDNNTGATPNPNQAQQPDQKSEELSMLDKVMQNNPFVKFGETKYENVQTQSMIKSSREEASEQLAQIAAYNAEVARQQKLAEEAQKAKRTGIYIAVGAFFAILLIVCGWMVINAIVASQSSIPLNNTVTKKEETKRDKVDGYKCTTDKCEKAATISENVVLVRDGTHHYLFDTTEKKSTLTTIPEETFHTITPFVFGEKQYLVLDPESSQAAVFSIAENRVVTEFAYDEFYYDVSSDYYREMDWIAGQYIVAKSNGAYRLVSMIDGTELVRANKHVFIHGEYLFGYENDNTIHVYNKSGAQILFVDAAAQVLYTHGNYLFNISADGKKMEIYEPSGEKTKDRDEQKWLNDIKAEVRISTLDANPDVYRIPTF